MLSEETLEKIAAGKIKDTSDKEWWEYVLEAFEAAGNCFTGESIVSTPEGSKPISEIRTGDEVISLDEAGNKRVARVIGVITPCEKPVVEVSFADGHKWNTTKTQWFYCGGDEYACVVDDQGKKALTLDGGKAGVRSVVETERNELVYDFVVEGLNVMFVNGIASEGYSVD